jgi:predicted transcriptional regulator
MSANIYSRYGPESLLFRTLNLLASTPLTTKEISDGAGVQQRWLQKLIAGKYADPGVNKVERVFKFLSSKGKAA